MRLRWGVYRAALDPVKGHEQAGTRPVLVISNEPFNRRADLVTVLPLTSARRSVHSWELVIPATACGRPVDSIVLPHQVCTISRDRLIVPPYGRIVDPALRMAVADRVLRHFGLHDPGRLALED